jgi:hypothetical protein
MLVSSMRSCVSEFVAALVSAACILAAQALPCAAQDATSLFPVKGVVLNSATHQPVARALVSTNTSDAVLTDNDGHFELNLAAGLAVLNLRRPGYGGRENAASHAIRVGADMRELTLYLTPNAILTGHVSLSSGDEADGIRIMLYRRTTQNGREAWTMQSAATTNSEGAFRFANLSAPASYLLYSMPAHDRIGPIAPGATSFGYPPAYFPGVTDIGAAGIVTVTEGQQAEADFTLTRQPFYPVIISMPNRPRGHGGGGVQVHDESGRTLDYSTRWNQELSQAQVNLPNGRYYAESRTGDPQLYGRVDFVVAAGPASGLSMSMLPLHPIPVIVRKDGVENEINAGGSGAGQVEAQAGLSLTLATTEAFESRGMGGFRHVEGSTDNSAFELEDVLPGRYWVSSLAFQGYVSSITSGGVDLAREPLTVGAGNSTAPIEVTIRADGGSITGTLSLGSSTGQNSTAAGDLSGAYVYGIPLFPTTSRVQHTEIGAADMFTFSNLAPGTYNVIAVDKAVEIDPSDAQTVAAYSGKGQTVTVEANGKARVQLDVIRTNGEAAAP